MNIWAFALINQPRFDRERSSEFKLRFPTTDICLQTKIKMAPIFTTDTQISY